jgi:hypothetical protein
VLNNPNKITNAETTVILEECLVKKERRFELIKGDGKVEDIDVLLRHIPNLSTTGAQANWLSQVGSQIDSRIVFPKSLFGEMHPEFADVLSARLDGRNPKITHDDDFIHIRYIVLDMDFEELTSVDNFAYGVAKTLGLPDHMVLRPQFLTD